MNPLLSAPAVAKMRGSPVLCEEMAALLANPIMEKALKALENSNRPSVLPESVPGVHPDTTATHEFKRMIGVNQTIEAIRAFATPIGPHDEEASLEGTEFTHNLPPELRERKKPTV